MFKHIVALLLLTALVILGMTYAHDVVKVMLSAHKWVSDLLMHIFNGSSKVGSMVRDLLALLAIPLGAGLIPLILYGVIRRHTFPYFMEIVWIVWLVQIGALAALHGAA